MANDLKGFIDYINNPPPLPDFHIKEVKWSQRRVSVIFTNGQEVAFIVDSNGKLGLYSNNIGPFETHARKLCDENTGGARVMVINYFGTPND